MALSCAGQVLTHAYVFYCTDKVRQVVPINYIRDHKPDSFYKPDKKYKVLYKNNSEDEGDFYKAYIISLGKSKLEAKQIGESKRFRIPKSMELDSPSQESQDDDASVSINTKAIKAKA